MKKLLFPAAALAIALSAPAALAADPDGNNNNKQHQGGGNGADNRDSSGPDRANGGAMMDRGGDNGNANTMMRANPNRGNGNDDDAKGNGGGNDNSNDNDRTRNKTTINDNDRIRNNTTINRTVNKTVVRKTVDRTTVLKFRANIRAPKRFHYAKVYTRPAGFYAHRWTFGERLPRNFFAPNYFILDFSTFGLMTPWEGYQWVRYGDDALLIDTETGEVIRTEYDIFY